jgi:ceramide glucosyltransferase
MPEVTLLIPVCGVEGEGISHFRRFVSLSWPKYQVVFTVLDPQDPAVPLLHQIQSTEQCHVEVQVGGSSDGQNLKIRNLQNAFSQVANDFIIICDADIKPEPDFIGRMICPLLESTVTGLVHSLYRSTNESHPANSWENVWVNCDFWVQGLLGDRLKGTDFAFGAAMAFHRKTLLEMGGLAVLKDYLADDYQLGNRIAKLGKRIVFSSQFVTLETSTQTWVQTWKHLLRWTRTIRVCQPGGHLGSIITNVTVFSLLALIAHPLFFWPWSAGALAFRVVAANQCRNWILDSSGFWNRWYLILFKDLAQGLLWFIAFRNGDIEWRGMKFRLSVDGKLEQVRT